MGPYKRKKYNFGACSYHLCKKRTKVYKCRYCGEFFCDEHLRAKPPGLPRFNGTTSQDIIFMEEWRKPGHPCVPFFKYWEAKIRRKEEEYGRVLDRLLRSQPIKFKKEEKKQELEPQKLHKKLGYTEKHEESKIKNKQKNWIKYIIIGLTIFFIIYFLINFGSKVPFLKTTSTLRCSDGTPYNHCSQNKPLYCFNGTLIKNPTICGCPEGYRLKGNDCELIPKCNDGTYEGNCSTNKPFYCLNGSLVKRASICGCSVEEIAQGEDCISKYEMSPVERTFSYVIRGSSGSIKLVVYGGLKKHLAEIPRYYYCTPKCPSERDLELRFLDEVKQKKYLKNLTDIIKSKTNNSDDQARIAISLVQKIPYDWEGLKTNKLNNRYPYEVLYDNKGVCGEKARLLAFILRELGFGVVLFKYKIENHMAVGIKCPPQYSYKNSGFCFIEASAPSIITDSEGDYINVGKLSSTPEIINISEGKSFDSVSEEYNDAQEWNRINKLANASGGYLPRYDYYKWQTLVNKYGIEVTESLF